MDADRHAAARKVTEAGQGAVEGELLVFRCREDAQGLAHGARLQFPSRAEELLELRVFPETDPDLMRKHLGDGCPARTQASFESLD